MLGRITDTALASRLQEVISELIDAEWYAATYPDVAGFADGAAAHFLRHGVDDKRNPNAWFDAGWYNDINADVASAGAHPLMHYLSRGSAELRDPGPNFDATFYAETYPEAAENPLLHHCRIGHARGHKTEFRVNAADARPSSEQPLEAPAKVVADVIIQANGNAEGLQQTLDTLLAKPTPHLGRVIVLDNGQQTPKRLATLYSSGKITLLQPDQSLGQAAALASVIKQAGRRDIVLLGPGLDLPADWLPRLAAQAYADPMVATVSPFTNTACWAGFPSRLGGAPPFGLSAAETDSVCRTINTGRAALVPVTNRHCLYIRRNALSKLGPLSTTGIDDRDWDIEFCLRASRRGWQNRVACDLYVPQHAAATAFRDAYDLDRIIRRYPDYPARQLSHQKRERAGVFRFAVIAAMLTASARPIITMVTHFMGGGVRRHIDVVAERIRNDAHVLMFEGWVTEYAHRAVTDLRLSLPDQPGGPPGGHIVSLAADQVKEAADMLRAANVSRVHVHHLLWFEFDTRAMIRRLGVPFDVTIHDNYVLCPQLNMLPQATSFYCGGPDIATCNACIAVSPSANQARDILSWRLRYAWQFVDADRIIVPSVDMKRRLQRFNIGETAIVVPHESVAKSNWPLVVPRPGNGPLRVVLLGTLANHKGSRIVAPVVETAPPGLLDVHCIGELEDTFPPEAAVHITATGRYQDADLPALVEAARPHVIWLPSVAPESYSYTLSAAIEAGLPIVATRFGAFPERLEGRPFTWLVDYDSPTETWLDTFRAVRQALETRPAKLPKVPRLAIEDFYANDYLVPPQAPRPASINRGAKPVIAVVPERFATNHLSPCAFIRLLQPVTYPDIAGAFAVVVDDAESVLTRQADLIITQRHALPDQISAEGLAAHASRTGARLVYDLDDDLLAIPPLHPDADALRAKSRTVRQMLSLADAIWVSSAGLAERLAKIRPDVQLVPNGLDERIWAYGSPPPRWQPAPMRILCMGSTTHAQDLALIAPALERLLTDYPERVTVDVLGMTMSPDLPRGVRRTVPPFYATQSYPAFVHWINTVTPGWHIGLAPLGDTAFNRSKSPIKPMDYAAMGLAVLASDVAAYRGSLADGPAGQLLPNDPSAWLEAMAWLIRDQDRWRNLASQARAAFLGQASLKSQAAFRRGILSALLDAELPAEA